ncbi:peptidylprolyl isomerase [Massilia glaciei]|uniref:peptidylprolyl isomerase n=1 Tax=Massilia glaciei TaxID=1524097 RepID=A0A2U2HGA2_9BURK|nr:peptidyl-prolyl cis-trans isomerase [Massilia glaciei]PWF43959.1 peptidylprolyl isomerase [Massilia glaciei]
MTFKPARLLLALLAVSAMPVFAQNLAIVNGKPVPSSRVEPAVKLAIAQSQGQEPDSPQLREAVKKDLVMREVMMQEAVAKGFERDAIIKQQIEKYRQNIVVGAMMRDYSDKNPPTAAELKAAYDAAKLQAGEKEYHVRHIATETEAEAKSMIAKIKTGAKFEELAKSSKDVRSAQSGGDLGWVTPSGLPKEFISGFTALQKGQVTENPVQTSPNSFHVIKLDDVRPFKMPTLEELKPQLSDQVQQLKVQKFQESLMKKAKIQMF